MEGERRRVLVAVDGSEQTQGLVDYLGGIISARNTELVLFHIMPNAPESFYDWEKDPGALPKADYLRKWESEREKELRNFMRDIRRRLTETGIPEYSIIISIRKAREGIARDLLQEARSGYDAIVVGRSGFGAAGAQVMGSVASKVVAKLDAVSLWLVGKTAGNKSVIIAIDSSESAMGAVKHVSKMVSVSNVTVKILHVVRGVKVSSTGAGKTFPEEYRRRLIEEAENLIGPAFDAAIHILVSSGIEPDRISTKVISGVASRAGAIFEEAVRDGCATIAVGRKGLSNLGEFDMGRVTGKLVQLSGGLALWVVA
jgi:nucleotide-binding universal stress UspA family protein